MVRVRVTFDMSKKYYLLTYLLTYVLTYIKTVTVRRGPSRTRNICIFYPAFVHLIVIKLHCWSGLNEDVCALLSALLVIDILFSMTQ